MERKIEIQMEASLAGVDRGKVKCEFVSVMGFGGVKLQRHSFVISVLDGWRVAGYKNLKNPHPTPLSRCPINWRSAVPQILSGRVWEQINNMSMPATDLICCGVENMDSICLSIGVKEFTVICVCIAARMSEIINFF
jgi:hypothetical protein